MKNLKINNPASVRSTAIYLLIFLLGLLFITGCDRPEVIKDLNPYSFDLVDQDSSAVTFPDDFKGKITVVGFIYTNCPHICSMITANLNKTENMLQDTTGIRFAEITFDPERDTPGVLKQYMGNHRLDRGSFTLMTGASTSIDSLISVMNIHAEKSDTTMDNHDPGSYLMIHTNRITLIDRQGRIRAEYNGSGVNPEQIIGDINKLR